MTCSAADSPGPSRPPRRRARLLGPRKALALALLLAGLTTACAEEPLPQRRLSSTDCLSDVRLDRLKEALRRCDAVVAAYPRDPLPLNERYLLHTLANDDRAACRDMARAGELARALPPGRLDPLLKQDLELRQADCRAVGLAGGRQGLPTLKQLPHQKR